MQHQFQYQEYRRRDQRYPKQFIHVPFQLALRRTAKHREIARKVLAHSPNLFLGIRYQTTDTPRQFLRRCFYCSLKLFCRFFGLLGVLHQYFQLIVHIHFQSLACRKRR